MLLVLPDPAKPKGAFFTYDPRVGRSYCIPFYELFDPHVVEASRLARTCVSWTTYVAAAPVAPLAVAERDEVEATVAPLRKPEPEPEPVEPIDEWWDAIKDPWVRLKDVATSATRREEKSPPPAESRGERPLMRSMAAESPRKTAKPVRDPVRERGPERVPERVPDELGPDELLPDEPLSDAREFVIPPALITPAPRPNGSQVTAAPAAPSPRERPRPTPARQTQPVTAPPQRRPQPLLAFAPPPRPTVALPADFHDDAKRWQRRRRIGFAVAAASFLGVIALSTLGSRTNPGTRPAAAAVLQSVRPAELTVAMNDATAPAPLALASAVDSLSGALAYYRDIANNHREGLVGCRVLDRAYALVGRARTRVDSSRQQAAGGLTDADSIRVSMLGAEYTFVAQTYRRSGCPSGS